MHSIKEIDMLVAKMDLLAKRVKHYENVSAQETLKAMVKKSKPIEEPEKPVKKKNRKRWRKKKDPYSNSSSPDPDPNKASKVEQEETPPPKDE
jgi:hypothetical protein